MLEPLERRRVRIAISRWRHATIYGSVRSTGASSQAASHYQEAPGLALCFLWGPGMHVLLGLGQVPCTWACVWCQQLLPPSLTHRGH